MKPVVRVVVTYLVICTHAHTHKTNLGLLPLIVLC